MAEHSAGRRGAPEPDPTLLRNQPAIRTGSRRRWLIPGGAVAAVAVGLLVAALSLQLVVPVVGIVLIGGLYAAMLVCAWAIPPLPRRNAVLAWLFVSMAVAAAAVFVSLLLVETRQAL